MNFFISAIKTSATNFVKGLEGGVVFDVTTANLGLFEDCTVCIYKCTHI